ncbi:hypothetical protein J2T57_003971 [Natronocella acetinitrilica]|uniref:J domain-containing protein n=1 Tax=Natronocella acetinitrilica TaxID=414046 RepID=A0AAE3G977_9GAMM|nr:DNA-J related domain-containing protein [Natronocella acetinitrilica]MCP1676798.1 hypothetical protein [Natronocella acetinitrilica]
MQTWNGITAVDSAGQILAVLRRHPAGLSEWELLRALHEAEAPGYERMNLADPECLFRSHFLLFHRLYRLDEDLRRQTGEGVEVHCLRVRLLAPPGDDGPAEASVPAAADPMRAYYLDLANMDGVDAAQVEAMISDFWRRLSTPDDRRGAALEVLGLGSNVDAAAIKRQYRRLVQRHHPDRGGETATLQKINEAMMILMDGSVR